MNSCEFVTIVSSVACMISESCSEEEMNLLAAVFTQLGDTLATISAHKDACCPQSTSHD